MEIKKNYKAFYKIVKPVEREGKRVGHIAITIPVLVKSERINFGRSDVMVTPAGKAEVEFLGELWISKSSLEDEDDITEDNDSE